MRKMAFSKSKKACRPSIVTVDVKSGNQLHFAVLGEKIPVLAIES